MSELISRRQMLKSGGMIALGLVAPKWLSTIAEADMVRQAKGAKATGDTVLVVCQLSGGNDALNTIIPYADKLYYTYRPTLAIEDEKSLKINESLAFHPALASLHQLYKEGKVAVVQNVGYPQPNRSHFKSMDIWQTASPDGAMKYGWIGRHFDQQLTTGPMNPVVALGLSTDKPLALSARQASIPCFASLADIQAMLGDPDMERMLRQMQGAEGAPGSSMRVVQDANRTALDAVKTLGQQLGGYTPKQTYGNDAFGNGFKQISQLLATSPKTRVVYFSAGGFDTHARQTETHERLLSGFANAVTAFQREMESLNKADKVIVLVFSEFGRRVAENGSQGTDHGAAGAMFMIGGRVKGGVYGPLPDLQNLQNGDLKYSIDFREVYAATLDEWMGGDSGVVLGQQFNSLPLLK